MTDEQYNAKWYIREKHKERTTLMWTWNEIEKLNLSEGTYKEIQAKISSAIAACDKSIQDHNKLLNQTP